MRVEESREVTDEGGGNKLDGGGESQSKNLRICGLWLVLIDKQVWRALKFFGHTIYTIYQ